MAEQVLDQLHLERGQAQITVAVPVEPEPGTPGAVVEHRVDVEGDDGPMGQVLVQRGPHLPSDPARVHVPGQGHEHAQAGGHGRPLMTGVQRRGVLHVSFPFRWSVCGRAVPAARMAADADPSLSSGVSQPRHGTLLFRARAPWTGARALWLG